MKNVLITLNPGLGEGLGPNFTITVDVAGYSWEATLSELLAGFVILAPDESNYVYVSSLGVCLNMLSLPIEPICDLTYIIDSIDPVSTTTTSTTTRPCVINPTVDDIEWFTTTTTTTSTTTSAP